MKVVFFTRSFYPNIGGVERHVLEVSKELIKLGHRVIVITEENKNNVHSSYQSKMVSAKSAEIFQGIKIYRIPITKNEKNKKFEIWKWLWSHKALIKDAEIVHAHDVLYWFLPFKLLYPTKKVYTTFHGYEGKFPIAKKAIYLRRISKYLSEATINAGDFIRKWYGTKAEITTYGGVTLPKKTNIKIKSNLLRILFIGRIEEDTGAHLYSEVLSILDNNKIEYDFQAIGDGSLRKVFERHGTVSGWVDSTDEFIENSDIVFVSSYLSILESFAHSKYVLAAFQNPLKKDYLQMTPFVKWMCISDEAMKFAHEVIAYSENKGKFKEKQLNAYEWVKGQTWNELAKKYLTLWKIER